MHLSGKGVFMKNFLKILWKIIKVIVWIIVILIVAVILVQRLSNNKLTVANYSIYTVVTESMVPKYKVGDMILAKKVDTNTLKVGDDIVYLGKKDTFDGKIVTHQIIEIDTSVNPTEYHTKGIANFIEDPVITGDQIYGKVLTKLTILSFLSGIVSNQYGFYFAIIIPAVILVFQVFIDVVESRKKSD